MYNEATHESCWVQIGIVSFGYGCADFYRDHLTGVQTIYPGFYSNVFHKLDWIKSNSAVEEEVVEDAGPEEGGNEEDPVPNEPGE